MAISYPTSLDTLTNPNHVTDNLDTAGVLHDVQHGDANDAIEALEAKVGITNSTVTSSHEYQLSKRGSIYPDATGAGDDDFHDGSFSGWTTAESQALSITETLGRCSVKHPGGGAAGNFSCRLKAHTFSTNDWCEAGFRVAGIAQAYNMCGLAITNGATWGTSNGIFWTNDIAENDLRWQGANGLNADTAHGMYSISNPYSNVMADMFLRLRYEGSNTFRGYLSCDAITWLDITGAITSYTLSPTHWGFGMTTWGGTAPYVMSLAYFKTGNG